MAASAAEYCNEHDYTTRVEVPLSAIVKTEIVDDDEGTASSEATLSSDEVTRVPVVLRDNKPKLRKKKPLLPKPSSSDLDKTYVLVSKDGVPSYQRIAVPAKKGVVMTSNQSIVMPPKQTVLLPRPIMPKISLPPPTPPNLKGEPPRNCKGVLVVQDVKFCTMYVPKGDGSNEKEATHSFPISALSKTIGVPSNLIPASAPKVSSKTAEAPTSTVTCSAKDVTKDNSPPSILIPNSHECTKSTAYPLLGNVQKLLYNMLPMYWFSAADKTGIDVMLMSFGKEKAIQRRVRVSYGGNVEITVHCKPLRENFIQDIVKKAGTQICLTETTVTKFAEWVLSVVQVVRDYQICTGLEHAERENRELYTQANDIYVDENPYLECRYTETLRSRNCLRLVDAGRRRCIECSKSFSGAKKRGASSTSASPKKKLNPSSDEGASSSANSQAVAQSPEDIPNAKDESQKKESSKSVPTRPKSKRRRRVSVLKNGGET